MVKQGTDARFDARLMWLSKTDARFAQDPGGVSATALQRGPTWAESAATHSPTPPSGDPQRTRGWMERQGTGGERGCPGFSANAWPSQNQKLGPSEPPKPSGIQAPEALLLELPFRRP